MPWCCAVLCCSVLCCVVLCLCCVMFVLCCVVLCCVVLCCVVLWFVVLCCVVLCCVVLCCVVLCCVVLCCVVLCCVVLCCVVLCCVVLCCVVLCCVVLCCVVLCCVVVCCAMLCCVVLCCVVLCCVVLCCVVLCCVVLCCVVLCCVVLCCVVLCCRLLCYAVLCCAVSHSVSSATGSQAYIMGWNSRGTLGLGDQVNRYTPQLLIPPQGSVITSLSLGRQHTAFLAGGACYVFGSNAQGQLGQGTSLPKYQLTPQQLKAPNDAEITAIQAGDSHTAFIAGGLLFVMGSNDHGQLGFRDAGPQYSPRPVKAPNGAVVTVVAVGADSTAFIAGRVCYVMGLNSNGQLGLGRYDDQLTPRMLESPNGYAIDSIALGWFHSAFTFVTTVTPTASNTHTPSPVLTQTTTPSNTNTPSTSSTLTATPSNTRTASVSCTPTVTPDGTRSATRSLTRTTSSSQTGTYTITQSATPSPTRTCTCTASSSTTGTQSNTVTTSRSGTPTATSSRTRTTIASATPTATPSRTQTCSLSSTLTVTTTASRSPTPSAHSTATATSSRTQTPSRACTRTSTASTTHTASPFVTLTYTLTAIHTLTFSSTLTATPSHSPTLSKFFTLTSTPSQTPTCSGVLTLSSTLSDTPTPSRLYTNTITPSSTPTPSRFYTVTGPATRTLSPSRSHASTTTPSSSPSLSHFYTITPTPTTTPSPSRWYTVSSSASHTHAGSGTPSSTPTRSGPHTLTCTTSNTPTSSRLYTVTGTPSSTLTPSRLYTITGTTSNTATASCLYTASSSASNTPTPSRLYTITNTPSNTPSPSRMYTATSTPSSTPTPSRVYTTTGSPSNTPTLSRLLTTTSTPSSTPTASLLFTGTTTTTPTASHVFTTTSTPSGTATRTPTTTPTLSRLFTLTASSSPSNTGTATITPTSSRLFTLTVTQSSSHTQTSSLTPTSSRLYTPSSTPSATTVATPTATLTSSGLSTLTATRSSTHSGSLTASPTATEVPTDTPTSTDTAILPPCSGSGASANANGVVALSGGSRCIQGMTMGAGSSAVLSRSMVVRVLRLQAGAHLRLQLSSGCPSQDRGCPDCAACIRNLTSADEGTGHAMKVGSGDVQMLVLYEPPAAGARRSTATAQPFDVELVLVHEASMLVMLIAVSAILVAVPCCVLCAWRHSRRVTTRPHSAKVWSGSTGRGMALRRHPRWERGYVQPGLGCGVCLMALGVAWFVVFRLLHHASSPSASLAPFGLGIAAAGAALFLLFAVLGLRDDSRHSCPVCGEETSRWRFRGTYFPEPRSIETQAHIQTKDICKGHTSCMRCVLCHRPVVMHRWLEGPAHNCYHQSCWEEHCSGFSADNARAMRWFRDPDRTDHELAALLCASIERGRLDAMQTILTLKPDLPDCPTPTYPSARHCAAALGRLPALVRLLEHRPGAVDACGDDAPCHSLLIADLHEGNADLHDLYVRQAPLSYNGRPVFVGHTNGKYVYFYKPKAKGDRHAPGWCLSSYLGDGATTFRLLLGGTVDEGDAEDRALDDWATRLHRDRGPRGLGAVAPPIRHLRRALHDVKAQLKKIGQHDWDQPAPDGAKPDLFKEPPPTPDPEGELPPQGHPVSVTVLRGRGLAQTDSSGKSELCVCVGFNTQQGAFAHVTSTVKCAGDPAWNELVEGLTMPAGAETLLLEVYDQDSVVGVGELDLRAARLQEHDVDLYSATGGSRGTIVVSFDTAGSVALGSMAEDPEVEEVELFTAEDVGLRAVPHAVSLLEAAVASGDGPTVSHVIQTYKSRYGQCLAWQHHIGHGLWDEFFAAVQQAIAQALAQGQRRLAVDAKGKTLALDLDTLESSLDGTVHKMRYYLQNVIQYRPPGRDDARTHAPASAQTTTHAHWHSGPDATGSSPRTRRRTRWHLGPEEEAPTLALRPEPWTVTRSIAGVQWEEAFLVPLGSSVAALAPGTAMLQSLCDEGVLDPTEWAPACKDDGRRRLELPLALQLGFQGVLTGFVAATLNISPSGPTFRAGAPARQRESEGRGRRFRGDTQSRFTDGLAVPSDTPGKPFYAPDYETGCATLQFAMELPRNPLGLVFEEAALSAMCLDAVVKLHELRRLRVTLSARHVAPIYVYTYELEGETDQIYGAMNRAMRNYEAPAIEFWRPIIWQLDRALSRLPAHHGKLYRGINVRFQEQEYTQGHQVCWPAFSSASSEKSVAQEFTKGGEGSLFFLDCATARSISKFSKFPDEAEVLFFPNTFFRITSTLYGTSDIGAFFSQTDNIAMKEVRARTEAALGPGPAAFGPGPPLPWEAAHAARIVLNVHRDFFSPVLDFLTESPEVVIGTLAMQPDAVTGPLAQAVVLPPATEENVLKKGPYVPEPFEVEFLDDPFTSPRPLPLPSHCGLHL